MSTNTTFEINKAEKLKNTLQSLRDSVRQDWQTTASALKNLKSLWNDNQSIKIDQYLEKLASNYQTIETDLDNHIHSISEQIRIAKNQQEKIESLKK